MRCVVRLLGDRRRLNDAPAGSGPERNSERGRGRGEKARDHCAACDGDRKQQRRDDPLFTAHVLTSSRRQLPRRNYRQEGGYA